MSNSSQPPNFLFLFPDQWRWDWLGCVDSPYGKVPVRTPHIDALAERGMIFHQCRTNSPLCGPARAALAAGVRYHRCGVRGNKDDLDESRMTIFRLLRDAGYRVLTCGKNDLAKGTAFKGYEGWRQQLGVYGFTDGIEQAGKLDSANFGRPDKLGPCCAYTSYLHQRGLFEAFTNDYARRREEASSTTATWPSPLEAVDHTDDFCGRMALKLLDRTPRTAPWMLWVNFPGPHDPFDPPRSVQQRYDGVRFPEPIGNGVSDVDKMGRAVDHQQIRRNYAAACEHIDQWVGRIIDAVERRGELERTVIVFSSDHGEMLGDHGRFTKTVPQEGSVHVPLVVAGPDIEAGRQSQALVELIDLSATFADLAGLDVPEDWDARSIAGLLTGQADDASHRTEQVSGLAKWRMICDGRYKRVEYEDGRVLVFDLENDPCEQQNLAETQPAAAGELAGALASAWPGG